MRLLSTTNLTFQEFWGDEIKPYTILSHTWSTPNDQEVTFKESRKGFSNIKKKSGCDKILECARVSKESNAEWTWIDTCCIDKRSSAELSEAINSMFTWYQKSFQCFVHLADFDSSGYESVEAWPESLAQNFRRSKWFTRGWTLQELLAPSHIRFFDQKWREIGTNKNVKLMTYVCEATGIPSALLVSPVKKKLNEYSVAQRMSWAAKRSTTRLEDIAYCLLGIFNVNMPLLYGEGSRAFKRLQEEIVRRSPDRTIFTWKQRPGSIASLDRSMFALYPAEFADCSSIERVTMTSQQKTIVLPFELTNQGLRMQVFIIPLTERLRSIFQISTNPSDDLYLLRLWGVMRGTRHVAVILRRTIPGGMEFARTLADTVIDDELLSSLGGTTSQLMYVPDEPPSSVEESI